MLRINIPSNGPAGVTFNSFENEMLPKPPNGIDEEINGDLVLFFYDEEQAIGYAGQLADISSSINDNISPVKLAINDIIVAVKSDSFVQGFMQ